MTANRQTATVTVQDSAELDIDNAHSTPITFTVGTLNAKGGNVIIGNAGTLSVTTLSLSGGTSDSDPGGVVTVGDGGTITATTISIGGFSTLKLADGTLSTGTLTMTASSTLTVSTGQTLNVSGDATITGAKVSGGGTVTGTTGHTFTQAGGSVMAGNVSGFSTYAYNGGNITGTVTVTTFNHAGATNSGTTTATTYTQTAGAMTGTANVADYSLSAGRVMGAGTVNFSNSFSLSGTGQVINGGTLAGGTGSILTQSGGSPFLSGTVTVGTYKLTASAASFTNVQGGTTTWTGSITASTLFDLQPTGDITIDAGLHGTGALTKSGSKTVILSGSNDYSGPTTVSAGTLEIDANNTHSRVTVAAGALLKGIGALGATTISAGGTHAPGNSIATQVIAGNYANAGTLEIEVSPTAADKLSVTGTVNISGAALRIVETDAVAANWPAAKQYTLIDNDGTDAVVGQFASITDNLAFLVPGLSYDGGDGNDVVLTMLRNDITFADVAKTPDQASTAAAIDALGSGNPLYDKMLWLSADDAQTAFGQLSGESYGTTKGVLIQNSPLLQNLLGDRIQQTFSALEGGAPSHYAASPDVEISADNANGIWLSGYGARQSTAATRSSAASSGSAGGVVMGLDGKLGAWTIGGFAGYGQTGVVVADLGSSVQSQDLSAGLYAGANWDGFGVQIGVAGTHHGFTSLRQITLPDTETLTASYGGSSAQVFGEVTKEFDFGRFKLSPYAAGSYVTLKTEAFTESGGAAALSSAASTTTAAFTTLGLRSTTEMVLGADMLLALDAGAGWQHMFGGQPAVSNSFAGGNSFAVGTDTVTIADNLAVNLGVDVNVSEALSLNIAYDGSLAAKAQSHKLTATVTGKF